MKKIEMIGLNEYIYVYETKCGLPIYMWVNEKITSMYASLSVKYGSIHTKFKVGKKVYEVPNGLAHYLEHVKFNVSDNETAHDIFYSLGGDANAFTTFDYTSYLVYATTNKEKNLEELLKFVYTPYFTKKNIDKERGIIKEEAKMGLDDPDSIVFFDSLKSVLQKSKYRNIITGTPDDIENITLDDINLVFDLFYHPKNMFLTITGNFNPYEMARVAEDTLDKFSFIEYKDPLVIKDTETSKVNTKEIVKKINITYPRLRFSVKMDKKKWGDYSNLENKLILNLILNSNFGQTSDFRDELLEKNLINKMTYQVDIYDDTIILAIDVTTKYVDELKELISNKLSSLSLSEQDFKRKKNAMLATLILDYEDIENVSMRIQDDILNEGYIIKNVKEIIENIKFEDINNFISLIEMKNVSINIFLPDEKSEKS